MAYESSESVRGEELINPNGDLGAILGLIVSLIGAILGVNIPMGTSLTGTVSGTPNPGTFSGTPITNAGLPGFQSMNSPVTAFLTPGGVNPAQNPGGQGALPNQGPTTGNSGSSASNTLAMANAGILASGGRTNNGQLTFTQYGGPTDGTPDKYTAAGLGNRGNQLRPTSLALSPDLIAKYGLRGGEEISVRTSQGTFFLGHYDDTTGSRSNQNVIDVYDPNDQLGRDSFLRNIPPGQWELVIGNRVP